MYLKSLTPCTARSSGTRVFSSEPPLGKLLGECRRSCPCCLHRSLERSGCVPPRVTRPGAVRDFAMASAGREGKGRPPAHAAALPASPVAALSRPRLLSVVLPEENRCSCSKLKEQKITCQ